MNFPLKRQPAIDASIREQFATHAHTFQVWRQGTLGTEAQELGTAYSLDDAERLSMTFLQHKDTLYILESHTGTGVQLLHTYRVRKGAAKYVRNPVSGLPERTEPMKLDKLGALPVAAFEPVRPFDALRDDPVGVDRTLVQP